MDMAHIRAKVMAVYDYKPGWVSRVNGMPDHQVHAIYRRFAADGFDPQRIKKDGAYSRTSEKKARQVIRLELEAEVETTTTYLCKVCLGWFEADNPELTECRFCGSQNILRGAYFNED